VLARPTAGHDPSGASSVLHGRVPGFETIWGSFVAGCAGFLAEAHGMGGCVLPTGGFFREEAGALEALVSAVAAHAADPAVQGYLPDTAGGGGGGGGGGGLGAGGAGGPRTMYWALDIGAAALADEAVQQCLAGTGLEANAKRAGALHATLAFRPTPQQEAHWLAHQNEELELRATRVAWDGKAAALAFAPGFSLPTAGASQQLHVTLAVAPGVKPEHSNAMLMDPGHQERPVDLLLHGKVTRHMAEY